MQCSRNCRIVQIDLSAAFDRINHHGILYKFCSVCVIDLNSRREFNYYRKTSIVFIIEEL